ncbi:MULTISPECIES: helix-turn-helix domain-containing protein [unclassified Gilliamella]|uniref:helix-turn-helix domain-containing protein n=1 Tax=unclassified Gilliamella TaxID=2685620 RepID=UPI001C6A613D|nr:MULTISPECIES: helix-turn-helix transcriptional regulator [unclassified Gilliamella]MCX8600924.1 helix-turn-helix domain-containing protein [Gilliamella sp. B3722]MCX8607547.1 helix-turn-helix domain-containing protein [Gilliamella sp. B3771]MCX8610146.1 helix-turn-helix domain-containing protein [Gilliamella sp. B3891]MCX8612594.1 helix-turn-helix domain-containing protein [Gilliamella sp. B3773]MCX8616224.1 helix-turn-helix domain-containing protein [Gilliamella sp. B3770]
MITGSIDYCAIGQRLRAYRIAASLRAEDVAESLRISRAAVYRLEKGEIVKIETLERLANLLQTSLASLLGIDTEYYSSGEGFFERMRQLEEQSTHIYSHFDPFSFLLTSPNYLSHLTMMLGESSQTLDLQKYATTLSILKDRKTQFYQSVPKVINLISLRNVERFLHIGLVGNLNLSPGRKSERMLLAREEVYHLIALLEQQSYAPTIAITQHAIPSITFQIFYQNDNPISLAISPFRLGELPNVTTGIASITSSYDAIKRYRLLFDKLWQDSAKDQQAIDLLKATLEKF